MQTDNALLASMFRMGHLKTNVLGNISIVPDVNDQERIAAGWIASDLGDVSKKT